MNEVQTIGQRVRNVLAQYLGLNLPDIKEDKTFAEHEADSLDEVEAVMCLEDEFLIDINDTDAGKLAGKPIAEYVSYIEARMAAKVS